MTATYINGRTLLSYCNELACAMNIFSTVQTGSKRTEAEELAKAFIQLAEAPTDEVSLREFIRLAQVAQRMVPTCPYFTQVANHARRALQAA